ncbi:uncharacterized protein A4U43_C10F11660, partial [Asparagus officinalis]
MADGTAQYPPPTEVETSPMAEETTAPPEESVPNEPTDAPHEQESEEGKTTSEVPPSVPDLKRKLEDLEGEDEKKKEEGGDVEASQKKDDAEAKASEPEDAVDAKRQRLDDEGVDGLGADGGQDVQKEDAQLAGNDQHPNTEKAISEPVETVEKSTEDLSQQHSLPFAGQQETSRKIEVPNNKVGVLIGKSGETIRLLQSNSGARIQITRDAEANPNLSTRPVELTGTLENIIKAEQLIKDVIAEADAGGSPALVARGFGATQSGSEVHEMQVPNEKVGVIIGKGGETIKALQTKSQARIQLIPQHLPEGDSSKERIVRITGNKKQIEAAKIMIRDVMAQMQLYLLHGISISWCKNCTLFLTHLPKWDIRLYPLQEISS